MQENAKVCMWLQYSVIVFLQRALVKYSGIQIKWVWFLRHKKAASFGARLTLEDPKLVAVASHDRRHFL
jgi:hypothetical protein